MTTSFHEREQAFEAKFAHDEEHRFLVRARRDKLFAAWAADKMHLSSAEKETLVKAVLKVLDGRTHDAALLELIGHTLKDHGQSASAQELAAALGRCFDDAETQISAAPRFPA
jgi:hypothetical protein